MGKNYYAYIKSEVFEWATKRKELLSKVSNDFELYAIIEKYFTDIEPKQIHLGKSSAGWKFLFQWNDGKYYKTKQELYDFIQGLDIVDEYGTSYTWEEFWNQTLDENRVYNGRIPQSVRDTQWFNEYIYIDGLEFSNAEFC